MNMEDSDPCPECGETAVRMKLEATYEEDAVGWIEDGYPEVYDVLDGYHQAVSDILEVECAECGRNRSQDCN